MGKLRVQVLLVVLCPMIECILSLVLCVSCHAQCDVQVHDKEFAQGLRVPDPPARITAPFKTATRYLTLLTARGSGVL